MVGGWGGCGGVMGLTGWGDVSPGDGRLRLPCGQAHQCHVAALIDNDVTRNAEYLGGNWKGTRREV